MSSNNASSTVTYTSVSSDSNGPSSWGILLENAGEILDMDPYEEVAQQGQAHPLSPAYVPDPMELNEHVPLYAPEPKHPEHLIPVDEDSQAEEQPYNEDASPTAESPGCRGARITVRPQPPMVASTQALIDAFTAGSPSFPSPPPINPTYDQAPLGHRAAMIRMRDDIPEEDMPPRRRFVLTAPPPSCDIAKSFVVAAARASRGQYDFVDVVGTGQGLVRSPGHDARTIARAADRARKRESEDFYTQLLDARTDCRDIRLEVDVVRGQRTAYEIELQEVRQAYLRSEEQNRALLARIETLETHMTRMEWQCHRAEDDAVRQIMCT
ncbi:hypothetical protein Tco_0030400, partial [Tanacetum coccineum]